MKFFNTIFIILFSLMIPFQSLAQLDYKYESLPCLDKTITIIAHIVLDEQGNPGITEEAITTEIDSLDRYFKQICLSFEICEFKYISNWQFNDLDDNEEWLDMQVKYHEANRLNMFFVNETHLNGCGFASLSGVQVLQSGGIVIKKDNCIGGDKKTIPHEVGHFFGLLHTFEGSGTELVNGANCQTAGDLICDTPSDPFVDGDDVTLYVDISLGCRFISEKIDANGAYYVPDVGNIMSYYPGICGCGFTHEQYLKMANTYLESDPKMW